MTAEKPETNETTVSEQEGHRDQPEASEESPVSDSNSAQADVHSEAQENLSEEAELKRQSYLDPKYRWYIVNTFSGSEETVRISLQERIARTGLEDLFGEISIPKMSVDKVLKSGKKKSVSKTSFPGYIMVQMVLTDQTMACVGSTPKVTGFVGNRKNPRAMADADVLRLMDPEVFSQEAEKDAATAVYQKGEAVKVIDGPFSNFDGVIDEVKADKMKVKVLVSIFGRETPVELSYSQIERIE